MGKWLAILGTAVLAVVLVAAVVVRSSRTIPTVREIQAERLTYDEVLELVRRHKRVENPPAYAAFLYRRAYGRNPGAPARQDKPA